MKKSALVPTKKATIQKNLTAISQNDLLSPESMRILEEKLPDWLKEYEEDGTAVQRWQFEYMLLMEMILQQEFGFSESQIDKLNLFYKKTLQHVVGMKVEIPRLLSKADFAIAMDMVKRNKLLYKAERKGIFLPDPFVKEITKRLK